ncbi:MAG TPA: D-glycero-beta-D-manno-heptose 1-phosphate adenylyltransferase [Bacteroidota bacterium]|nr:D-glycero-beta-D-manno-heptose 1-phosphate adenylyltransferase [Bacteroidota bacterium]
MGTVFSLAELIDVRLRWKKEGKKVVFTNGVFDILHRGHVEYLAASRSLGDALIVGVNSDASVKKIKGPRRPVVGEEDRAYLVSQLKAVDAVCIFGQETPYETISALVPDILVKGADWKIDDVVGKDVVERSGGKVLTIPFIPDRSTTLVIERIKELYSVSGKTT